MEHQTGPDGPAGTEEAEQAAALDGGEPESGSAADGAVDLGSPELGSAADGAVDVGSPLPGSAADGAVDVGSPESGSAADGAVDVGEPESGSAADSAVPMALEPEREPQPVPTTGEPRVDAALKLLDRLPGLPVSEHSEVFEQVHAQLSDVLGELDSGPALPAGG